MKDNHIHISRRHFIKSSTAAAISAPFIHCGKPGTQKPMTRTFGKLGMDVTTLGLGGQASLQWTPPDVDPVAIILKAFDQKINYFDTSNLYGPSQLNFNKAFRQLDLVPGNAGYHESLRESIFITTKSHLRWAKGGYPVKGVNNWSNGANNKLVVDDLKRSLSQLYGDGQGNYPKGAYLNMVLIHDLNSLDEVDILFTGLQGTDPNAEHIGALAALRDFRDGSNLTGLNPKEEKVIRHIGFSGHYSAPVMMEMIKRDTDNLLEGMLVAINSNDRLYNNMQHNVIPVAAAKNMGVIAMKVFADGAMYSKGAHWSNKPEHVVQTVGAPDLPSRSLVQYSLTTPGIHTAIIGTGHIDNTDPKNCQLIQNLSAAQISPNALSASDREAIEAMTRKVKEGKTNYFQVPEGGLTAPMDPMAKQSTSGEIRQVLLSWQSAYAGPEALRSYEILRDNETIASVEHHPQTTPDPFTFSDKLSDTSAHEYRIETVDAGGNRKQTEPLIVKSI